MLSFLSVMTLTCMLLVTPEAKADVTVVMAQHTTNCVAQPVRPEGNADINAAKEKMPSLGGMVRIAVRNDSVQPMTLEDISWAGQDIKTHAAAPAYEAVWWRMEPEEVPAGSEGIVEICLRNALKDFTTFHLTFNDNQTTSCLVSPNDPSLRLTSVVFEPDFEVAWIYVETADARVLPRDILIDGKPVDGDVKWLGRATNGVWLVKVCPREPFSEGQPCVFRVITDKGAMTTACVRAFSDITRFGTYGYAEYQKYADTGLDTFVCFGMPDKAALDNAQKANVGVVMTVGYGAEPNPDIRGHEANLGYLVSDEPDCADYMADETRPWPMRIGTKAPDVVKTMQNCHAVDPVNPVRVTLDLTFTPYNYTLYGPIPDVCNADCYPITIGWPVTSIREKAATLRQSTAPRPFTFTYQGCWEEIAIPQPTWISRQAIIDNGWQKYVDFEKPVRGFGRALLPEEVRMQMLYALGCGARGLFSYTDASEAGSSLIFHSSAELPEIWQEIGRNVRDLRLISPLLEVGNQMDWAQCNRKYLWLSTLWCADKAAIVVAVNETALSDAKGLALKPVENAFYSCADLPGVKGQAVFRVENEAFTLLKSWRSEGQINWIDEKVTAGAIYLISPDEDLTEDLLKTYKTDLPIATEAGRALPAESYLKGRRFFTDK